MFIEGYIDGATVRLRSVNENDAAFILAIRNDPQISVYLPPLNVSEDDQKAWIKKQRLDEDSYYFLIEDLSGKKLGTISLYDKEGDHCETGRFCSYGNFIQNTEAVVLLYDFIFYNLKCSYVTTWVYKDNKPVIAMNSETGFEWIEEKIANDGRLCSVGHLYPEKYEKKMKRIKNSLARMKSI